ncbi:MAG: hypothetical protein ACRDQ2_07760 [Gaiellales bacterium]
MKRCIDCGSTRDGAVMVGVIEGGSGPGAILYACFEHARARAQHCDAPRWLRDDIAVLDEREAAQ